MKKILSRTQKAKAKKEKKPILKRVISKMIKGGKFAAKNNLLRSVAGARFIEREKELVEREKFASSFKTAAAVQEPVPQETRYNLPARYGDNRIVLLPRDPWWIFTYWDITGSRVNEVVSTIPAHDRERLRWILRVYDVTAISHFNGHNSRSFFDIDINFDANNWYINVNQPECDWCVEIGLKTPSGKFFAVARSNIIKTPYFGISSVIDEEWAIPDDDYYRILGIYDLGRSSLERKRRFEEIIKRQISSPLASWGVSSLFSERHQVKDKFFLEVWTEIILHGRTEHDAHVTVEGKTVKLRNDGTFSLRYAMPVGDYKFEVIGTSKNKKHRIKKVPAAKRFDIVK